MLRHASPGQSPHRLAPGLFELLINTATAQPAQPDARRFRWDRAIDLCRGDRLVTSPTKRGDMESPGR